MRAEKMTEATFGPELDPVQLALAWHDGDTLATIATLLDDCRHLRTQLALVEGVSSRGMVRGWVPTYER